MLRSIRLALQRRHKAVVTAEDSGLAIRRPRRPDGPPSGGEPAPGRRAAAALAGGGADCGPSASTGRGAGHGYAV